MSASLIDNHRNMVRVVEQAIRNENGKLLILLSLYSLIYKSVLDHSNCIPQTINSFLLISGRLSEKAIDETSAQATIRGDRWASTKR